MAIPSKLPEWDKTQVNSTEVDQQHKDEGWIAPGGIPEKPPFQSFNWWQNLVYQWVLRFKNVTGGLDNMTELLSFTETVNGTSVNVRGYTTINDGGGGIFNYDSTVDKSTADAGLFIDPGQSLANQGDGVGSGCWVRQYDGQIEPEWYGLSAPYTIYASNTGSDLNTGFEVGSPLTVQGAFDKVKSFGPELKGQWIVELAAGTYAYSLGHDFNLSGVKSTERVIIRGASVGGHPNVPTTIFDGAAGTTDYEHGIRVGGVGLKVQVQDIKFINFESNNTRIGLVGENEVDFFTSNIHADSCDWCGVYAFNTVRARIFGGILNACRSGFITNSSQTTLYGLDGTPIVISNSTESGVYWSRGSQGHSDYVLFEDNAVGLIVGENSRVDTIKNEFDRNTIGLRTQTGGVFGEGGAVNIFGTGVDANGTNIEYKSLSGDTSELRFSELPIRVDYDRVTHAHSGVADTILSIPYSLKAFRLQGVGKTIKVKAYGTFTQVTAGSIIKIRFGGMTLSITVPGSQTNVTFIVTGELHEVQGGYRAFGNIESGLNGQRLAQTSTGFDETIDNDVSVGALLANAGDDMDIYRTDIYITG